MDISLETTACKPKSASLLPWLSVLFFVYMLLVAIGMIGDGFKWAAGGPEAAANLFTFASNPFTGLVIGLIATIMVQSSSTTSSIIVGLVAGGLPVSIAIPMILGTNIGTSTTATLVSLGNLGKRKSFRRSFTAATAHGLFNVIAVFIFLPLEIMTGVLGKLSGSLAHTISGGSGTSLGGIDFIKPAVKPVVGLFSDFYAVLPGNTGGIALAVSGLVLTFVSIAYLGKVLKTLMVGRAKQLLHRAIGHGPASGITSGVLTTFLVQSSTTSTSLVVPLVGAGIFKPKEIYPFTLGANIGTTITALLAATTLSGPTAVYGLQIALVHLLFNVLAVLFIYGNPITRMIPFNLARRFAMVASRNKAIVLLYVAGVFFIIPGLLILVTS
ncbi:Na/Pi cotransporter family protein [Endozoicomonas lisbonensis]|uniref:Sodium-dependent phosphate cotransporter n=1 Tax=Endozoicomonas lisbonensis TaxID=3120522 RepID=A0ABV2SMR8_9GAMM